MKIDWTKGTTTQCNITFYKNNGISLFSPFCLSSVGHLYENKHNYVTLIHKINTIPTSFQSNSRHNLDHKYQQEATKDSCV